MTREELLQISKPILFNTEMVRAILDGRKTETRRIAKGVPNNAYRAEPVDVFDDGTIQQWDFLYGVPFVGGGRAEFFETIKAPYKRGDILYLRETFDVNPVTPDGKLQSYETVYYKADGDLRPDAWRGNWKPSIYMPKEYARIFLKVKDVIPKKLQDITEEGTKKEGIPTEYPMDSVYCPRCKGTGMVGTYHSDSLGYMDVECTDCVSKIVRFKNLWDSTIKPKDCDKYGWDANPWVWVISFERIFEEGLK